MKKNHQRALKLFAAIIALGVATTSCNMELNKEKKEKDNRTHEAPTTKPNEKP